MALHIQMSEEAEKEYKRAKFRGMLSSFGAAAALSLTFALTLTFTVIYFAQDPPAEFLAYVPPAEDAPPTNRPTTPKLSSKAATPSNSVAPTMIVAAGAAPVAMAQIDVPLDDSADDGLSIDIGIGMDTGLGDDLGSDGGGMGSSQKSGSALEGVFYDLKMSKSGNPTKVRNADGSINLDELYASVSSFFKSWSQSSLSRYYKSPAKLYASNFFVPMAKSELAPEAFQCGNKVKPGAWIVVYRGKVKSPVSGRIRFLGTGDNCLGVRFGGKMVLEAGFRIPSLFKGTAPSVYVSDNDLGPYKERIKKGKDPVHRGYEFISYPGIPTWNRQLGGLTAGTTVPVQEGTSYPIEIAVMDDAGNFGFVLFWEHVSDNPIAKDGKLIGGKKAYIFRTNFSLPEKQALKQMIGKFKATDEMEWPDFDPESPIWVAVP